MQFRVGIVNNSDVEANRLRMGSGQKPVRPLIQSIEWTGNEYPTVVILDEIRTDITERGATDDFSGESLNDGHLVIERKRFLGFGWERVFGVEIKPIAENE